MKRKQWISDGQPFIDTFVLIMMFEGKGSVILGEKKHVLQKNTVHICPPKQTYGVRINTSKCMLVKIEFDVYEPANHDTGWEKILEVTDSFPLNGSLELHEMEQPVILCNKIMDCMKSHDDLDRFQGQVLFQTLIHFIMKNGYPYPSPDDRPELEAVKKYIERCYNLNITIDRLAKIANVSRKYFVDLFKKTYGMSAMEYVTDVRMKQAKRLMARSEPKGMHIKTIAREVGYQDEFYFSRKFKKETGVSPSLYMKKRRRKIASYDKSITGQLLALHIIPYAAPLHPKWTAHYYTLYREDIYVPLSAYRTNRHWKLNVNKLKEANLDMVISVDTLSQEEKAMLKEVGEIVFIPAGKNNWKKQLLLMADILGVTGEAEKFLNSYEMKAQWARQKLQKFAQETNVLILRISGKHVHVYCNRSMAEVFYHDLQMRPAYFCDELVYNQAITWEQLAALDADHILLLVHQETQTLHYWSALQHTINWQELKAVKNGHVHMISADPWCEYSASAHERMIDHVLQLFSGYCPE